MVEVSSGTFMNFAQFFLGGIYKHRKPQREEIEELSEGLGFLMICSFQQVYGIRYTILVFGAKFATTVQINDSKKLTVDWEGE